MRSYLPADHPDKAKEMGSEATPAEFIDRLLDVTEALERVLAPHGSLVVELGDTYSGSGGAGGDYSDDGWRAGQPFFRAKQGRESHWSRIDAEWLAALIDAEGSIHVAIDQRDDHPRYAPAIKVAMNHAAMVDRAHRITGVGSRARSGKVEIWNVNAQQARYVLLNIWPYLMVKQDQAKAAIELARHVEERRHGRNSSPTDEDNHYRETIRRFIMNLNEKGGNRGTCPVDWEPPTPHVIHHSMYGGSGWPESKSLCMLPESYRWALVYGRNPHNGRPTPPWRARNVVRWVRPNPPVGALGDKFRPATSELVVACKSASRWFDLDAVRTAVQHPNATATHRSGKRDLDGSEGRTLNLGDYNGQDSAGAPPLDWWEIPPGGYSGTVATTRREPCGPHDGGERTVSRDCPIHAGLPGQLPKAERDAHAETEAIRTPRNGDHPVQGRLDGSVPTDRQPERSIEASSSDSPDLLCTPAAIAHSTASSRTALAPATNPADTPSAETSGRTGHTSASPGSAAHHPDTSESSSAPDDSAEPPSAQTAGDTVDTPACSCSYSRLIIQSTSHYAVYPEQLCVIPIEAMCPRRVCRACGTPSRRIVGATYTPHGDPAKQNAEPKAPADYPRQQRNQTSAGMAYGRAELSSATLGWSSCGCAGTDGLRIDGYHTGTGWRPGVVLDPFVGSGTTMMVAHGHGRDSIGIDLDSRNVELARGRLGMFLEVSP